jgi:hypothetical protein
VKGDYSDPDVLVHFCSAACGCKSRQDSVALVYNLLMEAWLSCRPPIPAVNKWPGAHVSHNVSHHQTHMSHIYDTQRVAQRAVRALSRTSYIYIYIFVKHTTPLAGDLRWNKVYPPLVWWLFGILFHGLLITLMEVAHANLQKHDDIVGVVIDLVGSLGDEATFRKVKQVRWRRVLRWLFQPHAKTRRSLCMCATMFKPLLELLGAFFSRSRLDGYGDVRVWCVCTESPSEKLIQKIWAMLKDMGSTDWILMRAGGRDACTLCGHWCFF